MILKFILQNIKNFYLKKEENVGEGNVPLTKKHWRLPKEKRLK